MTDPSVFECEVEWYQTARFTVEAANMGEALVKASAKASELYGGLPVEAVRISRRGDANAAEVDS